MDTFKAIESDEKFERIKLAGQTYIVPPLCLDQLRLVVPAISRITAELQGSKSPVEKMTSELINEMIVAIHTSLALNYPDLDRAKFSNLRIGFPELLEAIGACARAAGLEWKTTVPGKPKAGEAGAAA